jgi:hypothetical protein
MGPPPQKYSIHRNSGIFQPSEEKRTRMIGKRILSGSWPLGVLQVLEFQLEHGYKQILRHSEFVNQYSPPEADAPPAQLFTGTNLSSMPLCEYLRQRRNPASLTSSMRRAGASGGQQ